MSQRCIPENDLPTDLTAFEAVAAAYPAELEDTASALQSHVPLSVTH